MSDEPTDFDLKMMPDWLKEAPAKNPYANYESKEFDRPRRDFDRSGPPRPGQRPGGGDRDRRSPGGRSGPRDEKRGPRRDQGRQGGGPSRDRAGGRPSQPFQKPARLVETVPASIRVEFLPDSNCVASVARQIKATSHACPLFGLAKMFLARPERHRVRLTTTDAAALLFQCGENGPIALDRAILEKIAFTAMQSRFYSSETVQRDPVKGNFTNVARCRLSGKLLGPTNYHTYQPTLRKLYEERFSRRMDFQEYLREIEISTNPEAVEAWKEEVRNVTTFKTLTEPEPVVFESLAAVEQHFRKTYLDQLIHTAPTFEITGELSRSLPDRRIAAAVKKAWEQELQFPGGLMHHLRRELGEAGLHIFKHRKRMQFISVIRPDRFKGSTQTLSENIAVILETIDTMPKCTRVDLANKILQSKQADPDLPKLKTALAADLHWLIHAGHVIEFQDGKLDLPLAPKQLEKEAAESATETADEPPTAAAATPLAPAVEVSPAPAAEPATPAVQVEAPIVPPVALQEEPPPVVPEAASPVAAVPAPVPVPPSAPEPVAVPEKTEAPEAVPEQPSPVAARPEEVSPETPAPPAS